MTRDRQDIIGCGSLLAIENGQIAAINYRLLTVCNGQGKNSCLNEVLPNFSTRMISHTVHLSKHNSLGNIRNPVSGTIYY